MSEDLFVRERDQRRVRDDRHDVVALITQLPDNYVREHLIKEQRLAQFLPSKQFMLALQRSFRSILGDLRRGYLRVDLVGV
jgi:hypothetical protein